MNQYAIMANRLQSACTQYKGYIVNNTFLERLKHKQLTNVDQYRKMQKAISVSTDEEPSCTDDKQEEWKTWQLAPVPAGNYSDRGKQQVVAGAEQLHRALRKIK